LFCSPKPTKRSVSCAMRTDYGPPSVGSPSSCGRSVYPVSNKVHSPHLAAGHQPLASWPEMDLKLSCRSSTGVTFFGGQSAKCEACRLNTPVMTRLPSLVCMLWEVIKTRLCLGLGLLRISLELSRLASSYFSCNSYCNSPLPRIIKQI
jgi:hypothetical protein